MYDLLNRIHARENSVLVQFRKIRCFVGVFFGLKLFQYKTVCSANRFIRVVFGFDSYSTGVVFGPSVSADTDGPNTTRPQPEADPNTTRTEPAKNPPFNCLI